MRPGPEQSRVVERSESPAHGEEHVLQHVFGIRWFIEKGPQANGQQLLCEADESLEMLAASSLGAEDQPRFILRRQHVAGA
jgi:hypothetical protein